MPSVVTRKKCTSLRAQRSNLVDSRPSRLQIAASPGGLYVGPDKRIEEFIYHRGGTKKPSVVITTWADYKKAGSLLISTDHRGTADEKPLRISLSDVSVKVTGSENWIKAQ
jgi:hypothetical protein